MFLAPKDRRTSALSKQGVKIVLQIFTRTAFLVILRHGVLSWRPGG